MKFLKFTWCLGLSFAASTCFAQSNPVPFVNQPLVPAAVAPAGPQFSLTVNGAGFVSGSVVNWNGNPLATTFVSAIKLTAVVPATKVSKAGTASVTVVSPSPGGGSSNPVPFTIIVPTSNLVFRDLHVADTTAPIVVAAADFNHDGIVDLAVTDQGPAPSCNYEFSSGGSVAILLGNGDGTFTRHSTLCFPDFRSVTPEGFIVAGDLNRDGNVDLVATYTDSFGVLAGELAIYRGNGDGTFTSVTSLLKASVAAASTPNDYIKGLALGDFENNGQLDIAESKVSDFGFYRLLLDKANVYLLNTPVTGTGPLAAGDFNRDGILDLADGTNDFVGEGNPPIGPSLGIFLNTNGSLVRQPAVPFVHGTAMVSGDFNGDSILDLATTNGNSLSVLLGNGDGTFAAKAGTPASAQTTVDLITADFNGDGTLDIATIDSTNVVSIWLGNGDGTFRAPVGTTGRGDSVASADFNGDGRMDLVVTNSADATVSILLQGQPYQALEESPIDADGRSVFSAKRGNIPVKFSLTENGVFTCTLPPASIAFTRIAGGTAGPVSESVYATSADKGSNFRIDPSACQYVYNAAASSLGVGTYRVDIKIDGIAVGNAVFSLR
jgi:hypothetical protein